MISINSNKNNNMAMDKKILSIIFGIFLLTSVSALYGGESTTITFDFEPVACSVTDNLIFNIDMKEVSIDIPINFLGNFTLTCFSGEEGDPVIVYRGGGGSRKIIYKNVTEYVDKIVEVNKIVEVEVSREDKILERIIEVSSSRRGSSLVIGVMSLIILGLLLWNFKKDDKIEQTHDIIEKEEKN